MDITPLIADGRQIIEGYGDGKFRIAGTVHRGSVVVLPSRTIAWPIKAIAELDLDSLAPVLVAEPPVEVLLIGCGPRLVPMARALRQALRERGIGADTMDTGAACRTFNVLLSEERRVAAALISV
ncbi:MAG: Mth938-like domain-containing protein [Proteobacteria bacterium]|nr:Mth938-like domain-containing protein [Pseudomonadota bacterium]MBI3498887.1 Mth938-like domain-containing protein [Pseudomonadota bacterium]